MSNNVLTFEELVRSSRRHLHDIWFPHGRVSFSGRMDKKRAELSADLWGARDILPNVTDDLESIHREYLKKHPDTTRGGAISKFGPTVIHCHVMPRDADEWLERIFDVVSDAGKLKPAQTAEEVYNELFNEIGRGIRSSENESEVEAEVEVQVKVGEVATRATSRIGQDRFSRMVKDNFAGKCCFPMCDVDDERLLVGAHIDRWADSPLSRGIIANGLCLCSLHDRAFELGFFVLMDDYRIAVRETASASGWVRKHLSPFDGEAIRAGKKMPSVESVQRHRHRHE